VELQLIRHATLRLIFNQQTLLIDPMLSPTAAMDPIANSANDRRNPLVPLPVSSEELIRADAVIITHTHRDHLDPEAIAQLPKSTPIFCQPHDRVTLQSHGFSSVIVVEQTRTWNGVTLTRTGGQHGRGEIGEKMGPVSGFVLSAVKEPSLYVAGDTIYCPEVEQALRQYVPDVTVLNAGAARFKVGDPITMTAADVVSVCRYRPQTQVVAVHMEAINHCLLTRSQLQTFVSEQGYSNQVWIPEDGERMYLAT
jgi:L-ascorbate metabolism protein UlaG (beta-lactamase superfamily)